MKRTKTNKPIVKCMTCAYAELHRWGNDPVIADCHIFHEREVANQDRVCQRYLEEENKRIIQH